MGGSETIPSDSPGSETQPRIALVTPLFPLEAEPYRGQPIYRTALALRRYATIEAFCPIAVYPRFLKPRTYQVRPVSPGWSPEGIRAHYFPYATIPGVGRYWNGPSSGGVILPALREFRPDVILSYWIYPEGFGAVSAGRRLGIPVIAGSRGSDLLRIPGRLTRFRIRQTLSRADAVLTVSDELRRAAQALGAPADRTHVILNGCDSEVFRLANRDRARAALNLPAQGRLALYVGHLIPSKGIRELMEAFTGLVAQGKDLRLALVGEGSMQAELAARRDGLGGRLLLPGPATPIEVAQWMAASDFLCLPSYSEGCPNVVLESLCCGRPVAGATVGSIPDLITPDCGRLIPPRDGLALRNAIGEMLHVEWNEEAIAARFRRGWDDVARETFAVCLGAMEKRPAIGREAG